MASEQQRQSIQNAKVLMVGAGGIGCELLKTLALSGFQDIHIVPMLLLYLMPWLKYLGPFIGYSDPRMIDMDTIEVSNLNRQFLFRQSHVGQSKAKVAREAVLRFRPHISITAYHANVKDSEFNAEFFKQFNVVLNGLDNLDARRHVNRLCLAAEVPLVESGTTGFLGQVTVHVKGKTECYECQPKPTPKTYPVCTITSTPSKFVHCIVWAKDYLFTKLFGDKNLENDLYVHSNDASSPSENVGDAFEQRKGEEPEKYGRRIYDTVFGRNIKAALANEETWKNRNRPKPIYSRDVLPDKLVQRNGNLEKNSTVDDLLSVSAMTSLGLRNPQDVWSMVENTKVFLESLKLFLGKREKEIGNLIFDKDDQLAVEFVTAAANIRAESFGIPMHSLFEAKGIAGNIIHAVATTNAVVAGLIVIEATKVLQNDVKNYRMTYCLEHPSRKMLLMPVEPFEPNKSCFVCSKMPLSLEVNTHHTKLRDFVEKIVKAKLGMNSPFIMNGSAILYEVGDDLDEDMVANYEANLEKVLAVLPSPVTSGTSLTVEDLQQELKCEISIEHREEFDEEKEPDGMLLTGWTQAPQVEKDDEKPVVHRESTLVVSQLVPPESEDNGEIEIIPSGTKRKLLQTTSTSTSTSCGTDGNGDAQKLEVIDYDDELVIFNDCNSETSKRKKLL